MVVPEMEPRLLGSLGMTSNAIVLAEYDYRVAPLGTHSNYVCQPQGA